MRPGQAPGRPVRWGIIGTGSISRTVTADLQSCEGADVIWVHSRGAENAAAFASHFGIPRWTGDLDEMLGDASIDAVYIATPISTHVELVTRALRAGKHVLAEKPLASTALEAEELFALSQATGRFLMEAMWMKFNPAFLRLMEEIAAGRIGEVRAVRAAFGMPSFREEGGNRASGPTGGALLDRGIYPVTLAHALFGEPASVHASGRVEADGLDLEEHFILGFDGGGHAYGAASVAEFIDTSGSVSGTRGWIALPGLFWVTTSLEIHAGSWERLVGSPERVDLPREGNGYVPMLRAVTEAIEAGEIEHRRHPAAETIAVFRTLDRIRAQIRSDRA